MMDVVRWYAFWLVLAFIGFFWGWFIYIMPPKPKRRRSRT